MRKRYVAILLTLTVLIVVFIMRIQEGSVREYVTMEKNGGVTYLLMKVENGKVNVLLTMSEKKRTSNKTYTVKQERDGRITI
ncbi:hypothetical protein COI88_27955 [Bacillus cereus]|nr:hypothetical protein COI88_27955 [Bacillus cereus]